MEPYEAYCLHLALTRHFNSKSYNYNKFRGKVNTKYENFLKRRDRGLFYRLGRKFENKEDLKEFIIANAKSQRGAPVHKLFDIEADELYNRHLKIKRKLLDYFYKDLRIIEELNKTVKEVLVSEDGAIPDVFRLYLQEKINLESLALLETAFRFIDRNDELEDPLFDEVAKKVHKYMNFMSIPTNEVKNIIKIWIKRMHESGTGE